MPDKTDDLLNEREKTHGDAFETFRTAAELCTVIFRSISYVTLTLKPHHFALINILHKVSRIVNGSYHEDHWNDIEGYARLGKKLQEKDSDRSN